MQLLLDNEVIALLRELLGGRRVKIVTEHDFGVALTSSGAANPVIKDESIFKETIEVDYKAAFTFILPSFVILLLDVEKRGREFGYAFVFLPEQFHLAEIIGEMSLVAIASRKGKVNLIELGRGAIREVHLLKLRHLFPELISIHQKHGLDLLKAAFPEADWIVEYQTRELQVSGEKYGG
ncbi:MAG: hypothetical protein QI197_04445 [Candidatus Korarchaeota archaeon]|nr:hypothetical protein [Candidatus Korarchaeota archaeon]